jgi:uncharacterized phage-associated protein
MSSKITAIDLSYWIIKNFPDKNKYSLTPLKLQKLTFYCFSIALAKKYQDKFNKNLCFEPWKHGPVSREIYKEYKIFGCSVINIDVPDTKFENEIETLFKKVIYIYGALPPWKIVQQTHLEEPYDEAYKSKSNIIDPNKLEEYFKNKFFTQDRVKAPELVFDLSSFYLDGIPVVGFSSFDEMAEFSKKIFFDYL